MLTKLLEVFKIVGKQPFCLHMYVECVSIDSYVILSRSLLDSSRATSCREAAVMQSCQHQADYLTAVTAADLGTIVADTATGEVDREADNMVENDETDSFSDGGDLGCLSAASTGT